MKGKGQTNGHQPLNAKAILQALYIVVLPSDEAISISCLICKELLKSEFLWDGKGQVWKNMIKKDDQVC